jgi:hypothetical protein
MEKTKTKDRPKKKDKTKKVIILRKKFKGGQAEAIPWDYGGTAIEDLPADIIGVIVHTINTIVNAVSVVDNIVGLPANMGTAFSSPNEPNPDDVDVSGL